MVYLHSPTISLAEPIGYNNNNNINNNFISRVKHIWHECQSNIWSSDTMTYMRLIITDRTKIIYSMYRAVEVSVHRACC